MVVNCFAGQYHFFRLNLTRCQLNLLSGVSRSCTIAVSYLMQKKGMRVEEALVMVKKNRDVHPNNGFLEKLIKLDEQIQDNE